MRQALIRAGEEHRLARVGAGLSLRACADASGASYQQLFRFEHGLLRRVTLEDASAWFAVLGQDLVFRTYPAGDPIRDQAQLGLLERLRVRLHPTLRWSTEVPLPIDGDLRAWDAEIRGHVPAAWRARVEAETRIGDGQALERKLSLKLRDDPDGHLILLVSDTRANRAALKALAPGLRELLPGTTREILTAVSAGREPAGAAS
ncbi:MAG TPA: hypothetical protein VFV72_02455 [Candidatus Limnocylindrales bacterium]|nr:hypothetical protein [Candidatus Limnocylindrales bacterium]